MELSFYPLALDALDQADAEALCLFVGADERPLGGLAGLTDWRLAGRLSSMIRAGILTGAAGEALLTPPGPRLSFRKLFLFGLGPAATSDGELQQRVSEALRRLSYAGVRDVALQLPPRIPLEAAVRALVDEPQAPPRALLFAPEPAKLIAALSQTPLGQAQIERRVVKVPSPPKAAPPARSMQRTPTPPDIAKPVTFVPENVPPAKEMPGRRPAPPPPQRYVPPEPKPSAKKKR
jgi:Cytosol aminopeptidase family, N-terminal domain